VQLLRVLGIGFGLAVIVGNTIGAAILRTPGEIAARLPTPWLFIGVWVVGGLYAALGANSLAELGTMLPRSGGQYVFARHALGPYAGFVVGWNDWLSTCGTVAAVAIVIAESAGVLVAPLDAHSTMVATLIVVAFTMLLWRGIRWGDRAQRVTSALKAAAFLALIAACFAIRNRVADAPASTAPAHLPSLAAFVVALQSVIFAYEGWTSGLYFSEEVRDPGREIPRSMFGGLLAVVVIYLLVNAAFLHVLPLDAMSGSRLVAGTAAAAVFGARGETVVRLLVIIALLSAMTSNLLIASRVVFAMARDGLASRAAERVNPGGTPTVALLLSAAIGVFFLVTGTFERVAALLAFFYVSDYVLSFTSLFVLRRREPEAARPYRAWGYPWTTGLALAGSLAFLAGVVVSDPRDGIYALVLVALSFPAYRLVARQARIAATPVAAQSAR
jgi:APA family basic amino acid/polyamine antiporter